MRIIAVANQKGGCGKTTVIINLAACLAREGRRVLVVDLDPQGHCALGLAVPEEQIEQNVRDLLLAVHESRSAEASRVTWQISSNFDLIPSKFDLSSLEQMFAGVEGRASYLGRVLDSVRGNYDYVLVDTPPTVGFLTASALDAATDVVVPVDTGYFSLQGLSKQLDTIRTLRAGATRQVSVRILANLYDVRTKLGREILAELRKRHGDAMLSSFINFNTKLKESTSLGQPITEYDPSSMGCRDFVRLAREVIAVLDVASTPARTASRETHAAASAPAAALPVPTPMSRPVSTEQQSLLQHADALAESANKLLATSQTLLGGGRTTQVTRPTGQALPSGDGRARPAAMASAPPANVTKPHSPVETERRIAAIYGVRPVEDGVAFVVAAPGARIVGLAGDFNDWQPERTPLRQLREGTYEAVLPLSPGRYRYRYVIDGAWRSDPANHNVETNPFGELNSVVEVV